jgi:hypothetical protein
MPFGHQSTSLGTCCHHHSKVQAKQPSPPEVSYVLNLPPTPPAGIPLPIPENNNILPFIRTLELLSRFLYNRLESLSLIPLNILLPTLSLTIISRTGVQPPLAPFRQTLPQ